MTAQAGNSELEPDRRAECRTGLKKLWEKNLGVPVDIGDDYFGMGGNSLLGAQLLAWIHEGFGVELSLLDLFEHPRLEDQVEILLARPASAMGRGKPTTKYFHFGAPNARLFGALHSPASGQGAIGVVLCYPIGQEYMRVHRTYVELARSLALAGKHVLRFDYYGCGDSAGISSEGDFACWRQDIAHAVRELRARTSVRSVYLIGSRVGANLALDVVRDSCDVAGIVLWEPVASGTDYIAALRHAHDELLDSKAVMDGYEGRKRPGCFVEFIGFSFTKKLHDEVIAIDLAAGPELVLPTLVLSHSHKPFLERYAMSRAGGTGGCSYVAVEETDAIWLKADDENKGVIPAQSIQAIVSWVNERAA